MNVQTLPVGQMKANCYLLEKDDQVILIDPGDEADFILEKIARSGKKLSGIIATHGHFDHIMAVGEIQLSYNLPLFIHKKDEFLTKRVVETGKYFLGYEPATIPIQDMEFYKEGDFKVGEFSFKIIETPGHTPGSCCFYFKNEDILFSGDTLFNAGVGRYDFSYSSKNDLKKSIEKILKLPKETVVYTGHGEEAIIGGEQGVLSSFF